MSSYTAISGVTRTLSTFINSRTGVQVDHLQSPDDNFPDSPPQIHLYLYRVEVNPHFLNAPWPSPTPTSLRQSPLGVNLLYVITPYGADQLEIQVTLGEVMKVFHETPIIPPADLDASIADTTQELRVVPRALTLEQMTEFWRAFDNRSYRLALTYEVSTVLIDSDVTRQVTRVEERRVGVGTLK